MKNINIDKEMELLIEAACGVGQNPEDTGCEPASASKPKSKPKVKMPKLNIPSVADMMKKGKERAKARSRPDRKPNVVDGVDVIRDKKDEEHFIGDFLEKADKGVDSGEYDEKMRKQYEEQQKKRTPEQRKQQREDILSWKTLGGFEAIERAVEEGTATREEIQERNERISEISHTTITKVDRPIERGISVPNDVAEQILADFEEGKMVEIPDESGHGSSGFSTSAETARGFANVDDDNPEQTSIVFRIEPNSNGEVRGAFIDGEQDEKGDYWSEGEITRSSKSKAKVKKVERTRLPNGKMVVIVTLQEPDDLSEVVVREEKGKVDMISRKYLEGPLNPEPQGKTKEVSKEQLEECIAVASMFGNDMVLGKNRDRNYNPNLKVVRELTGYGVELCFIVDQDTDWSEGMNSHGIGIVNSALFVKRDEKDFDKSKKKKAMSKDGARIREALRKTTLHDAVKSLVTYHGGIKGHTLVGDGKKLVVIENTSRVKPVVKIKDLTQEPIVRTNHGIEHPEQGYQNGNDKLSSELRLMNALNVLHQTPHYKELFPAFYNHIQDKGPKYDLVRAQNKLWTSSQVLMNLNKREILLYLVPNAVTFIGVENKLPNDYKSKISFIVKEYEHTPDEKYRQFVPTTKKPKYSALVGELVNPILKEHKLKPINEAGEQYYWPQTKLDYIKGIGYDSVRTANKTIESITNRSKSEQKEIVETMYNRAKYHKSQTSGMRKAMEVFDEWLSEDNKKIKKVVGIYGGRYQPFGPHHLKTYKWLKSKVDDAYITTSDIKKPPKHPMNYREKVRHMTKMGVPKNRIIKEKVPLVANKVLKKYDPETTTVIYIFGEKDAGRLAGGRKKSGGLSYFQDYKKNKNNLKGYEEHGYFMTAPHQSVKVGGKEVSGTVMRELLGSQKFSDEKRRKLFKDAFGYFDEGVFLMMHNKFKKLFNWKEQKITEATGGKLVAARNKGHLKNGGKTALSTSGIISKFKGRGDIEDAFSFAMKDLERAIGSLSDKQRNKIFKNGKAWMNLEVMWPKSANVINYDKAEIVFHGAIEYDDNGNAIGEVKDSARMLAGMIKQVNQNIQKRYKIGKPNFLTVPKHQNFEKRKKYFFSKLNKLQKQYGLKDNDSLSVYHQSYWEEFIFNAAKQHGFTIPKTPLKNLTKRWAFFDKSYKIPMIKKDFKNHPEFLDWVLTTDKVDHSKMVKKNMKPFEELFFEVGAEIMTNVSGWLAANPDSTVQRVKKQLDSAIKDVRSKKDLKKLNTLKLQLDKLNKIGGLKAIVPSEGIVFKYNGKTYKFTGAFAPINQITGLMTF